MLQKKKPRDLRGFRGLWDAQPMQLLKRLALLTLFIAWAPVVIVIGLQFLVVRLGGDESLGEYFELAYFILLGLGAYLYVRFVDR